jgi:ribosomal protein S27AE
MSPTPRSTIDDGFIAGRACAVCGATALVVKHAANLPDHVACGRCGSIFVVEGEGDRVMYGKIPADYPATRRFALKQWVWIEAVERRAQQERMDSGPLQAAPQVLAPRLPRRAPAQPSAPSPAQRPAAGPPAAAPSAPAQAPAAVAHPVVVPPVPAAGKPVAAAKPAAPPAAHPQAAVRPAAPGHEVFEPPPGERHRVVIRGERVLYPANVCAHCLRSPTSGRLAVISRAPAGQKPLSFNIPLCESCLRRASARPVGERGARLQAHLVAILVAMIVIVGALAVKLVDLSADLLSSAIILGILAILGYGLPALLLLSRAGRGALPPDAIYVRTTVRIPVEPHGMEVPFEWRNARYADLFLNANREWAMPSVTTVAEPARPSPA